MRQTIRVSTATFAAAFTILCLLYNPTVDNLDHLRTVRMAAARIGSDNVVVGSIEPLAPNAPLAHLGSLEPLASPLALDAAGENTKFTLPAVPAIAALAFSQMTEASIDIPTDAPVVFSFPSRKPKALVERPSFDMPAAVAVAHSTANVRREARVPEINAKKPARHSNFASLESGIDTNVDRIRFDTPSLAPLAFMRFCVHYPQDCNDRLSPGAEPVDLTDARKAELSSINREVNREIRPQENFDGLAAEQWLVSPREGDCNDYAVTKRHKLLARGWPSRSLLLAEVIVPSGEHHLVLIVRTREADLVLDNLNWNVRPVSKIRYRWVRAQQEKNPKIWSTISVTRAARIAMNER